PLSVNLNSAPVPTPFISLSSNVFTLTVGGTAVVSVSGDNLTAPITITTPSGFAISTSSISVTSTNFGSANGILTVTFTGTSTTAGSIGLSSGLAKPQYITLAGVLGLEEDLVNGITSVNVYPNPSNGSASIDIALAKSSTVLISINDVTGQIVSTVSTDKVSEGIYKYEVDNLKSGLYFITIIADGYKKTEKLVVY
ncbi:MAG: T9SS type A sorting domain-containing protein, partial [Cytophagales bacterium]|nr:T9SS type A sorting domain-containing protein [Cytophagales bacterium]